MKQLSLRKKLLVLRLYFEGLSYDEIAVRAGIGKGTVANIISELKAGSFPEAGDLSDQLEAIRELAVDLRHSRLTLAQASIGLTVLSHLTELGVEPSDIENCAALGRIAAAKGTDIQSFTRAALSLEKMRRQTGLSVDELESKVNDLQERACRMEPLAKQAKEVEKQITELDGKKQTLNKETSKLQERAEVLRRNVKDKEQREAKLSGRVSGLEERAQIADERLANARKDLRMLSVIGITFDDLSGLTQRLKGIAQRHHIDPNILRERLLFELEQLDEGLGLETTIQAKQRELRRLEKAISTEQEKSVALESANQELQLERSRLEAELGEGHNHIVKEIKTVSTMAQHIATSFKQSVVNGVSESLVEIARLKNQSLELGRQLGQFETMVESNRLLKSFVALVKGDDELDANHARVIGVTVLGGLSAWLERNYKNDPSLYLMRTSMSSVVSELERWKP